jgi:hypothetical protein
MVTCCHGVVMVTCCHCHVLSWSRVVMVTCCHGHVTLSFHAECSQVGQVSHHQQAYNEHHRLPDLRGKYSYNLHFIYLPNYTTYLADGY